MLEMSFVKNKPGSSISETKSFVEMENVQDPWRLGNFSDLLLFAQRFPDFNKGRWMIAAPGSIQGFIPVMPCIYICDGKRYLNLSLVWGEDVYPTFFLVVREEKKNRKELPFKKVL